MEPSAWKEWYDEIAKALHLSEAKDRAAGQRLAELLSHPSSRKVLIDLLQRKASLVLGAGPSLEHDVEQLRAEGVMEKVIAICADGATSAFIQHTERPPEVIVTDLDGNMEDIIYANRRGAVAIVHAHGDNVEALNEYVPLFRLPLLGTTQVGELANVHNFGGFTDGDRAAFTAETNGSNLIILAGMDFGSLVGRHSKPGHAQPFPASERKLMKLGFAKRLLEWLAENGRADVVNCTRSGEDLKGIPRVEYNWLRRILH